VRRASFLETEIQRIEPAGDWLLGEAFGSIGGPNCVEVGMGSQPVLERGATTSLTGTSGMPTFGGYLESAQALAEIQANPSEGRQSPGFPVHPAGCGNVPHPLQRQAARCIGSDGLRKQDSFGRNF
jgi:hypothetical protein